jgi:amino acid transporter
MVSPSKEGSNSNVSRLHSNELTKFFLIISLFIVAISVLAVYSTIAASEYGIKKDDVQTKSLTHLLKSVDWWNDYQEQKLGEKFLQTEIDDLNFTLHNNNNDSISSSKQQQQQDIYYNQILLKHQSYIDTLHADKTVYGSLANLKYNAETEQKVYEESLLDISENSKFITIYEFITILLIIGTGLGGLSEIAKNKVLGYSGFVVGSIGVIVLLLVIFVPSTIIGGQEPFH